MALIYTIFNAVTLLWGRTFFRKWLNPLTVYGLVWECAVLLHQSGLVAFFPLSLDTWVVIFLGQILFALGCYVGMRIQVAAPPLLPDAAAMQVTLKRYMILSVLLSGIAIIGNYLLMVAHYGNDLLGVITQIYADRVNSTADIPTIPYLDSFIYVAIALAGIYLRRFGFSFWLLPILLFTYMKTLVSGGRAGLVFVLLIFVFSFLLSPAGSRVAEKKKKRGFWQYAVLLLLGGAMVLIFVVLTMSRSVGVPPTFATDRYLALFGSNNIPYRLIEYAAAPIGALNEYLKDCDFSFGINTFKTVYNILGKFGLMDEIDQYQQFYETPLPCNVATWLRELIQDFSAFAILAVFLYGFANGLLFKKVGTGATVRHTAVLSVLMMVVAMSFFDWKLRSADLWIAILFGYLFGYLIDRAAAPLPKKE